VTLVNAAISWAPEIRNILSVLVGLGVLVGSMYLILATNTGARLGLLITLAALFGWMTIMGAAWWVYGIGMQGEAPSWEVIEVNTGDLTQASLAEARPLPEPFELPDPAQILADDPDLAEQFPPPAPGQPPPIPSLGAIFEVAPELRDELDIDSQLAGWDLLITSDPQRGDAQATADAALGPDATATFETTSDYKVLDVYSLGGKPRLDEDANRIDRIGHKLASIWNWSHPTHYAVVQVQGTVDQEVVPGEAPPPPVVDEDAPVVSVIMRRDLGDLRFPAAMVTLSFGILFALSCNALHRRDKLLAQHLAAG